MKNSHSIFRLIYHLVLVTKFRKKIINDKVYETLKNKFISLGKSWRVKLKEMNYEADHIHILFETIPDINLQKFVQNYKTVSSILVRKTYPIIKRKLYGNVGFWKIGYYISSTGGVNIDTVKKYIENQKN